MRPTGSTVLRFALIALVSLACVEPQKFSPFDPDIRLVVAPEIREIREGSTIQVEIAVERAEDSIVPVTLRAEDPPDGILVESLEIDANATNAVVSVTAQGAPVGSMVSIGIAGVAGTNTSLATLKLFVLGKPATIDTSFGAQGELLLNPPEGFELVGGGHQGGLRLISHAGMKALLLDSNGLPDPSFGINGVVDYSSAFGTLRPAAGRTLAEYQSDDRLVIIASFDDLLTADSIDGFLVIRILKDGTIDRTVGDDGTSVVILRNARLGSLVVGPEDELLLYAVAVDGLSSVLVRLSRQGEVLQSREPDALGILHGRFGVQQDRKVVAVAYTSPNQGSERFAMRFNANLSTDLSFGSSGKLHMGNNIPTMHKNAAEGFTFVGARFVGNIKRPAVWRFDSLWQPTSGFTADGIVLEDVDGTPLGGFEDAGRIVIAAYGDSAKVVFLKTDGSPLSEAPANGTLFISYLGTNDTLAVLKSTHSRAYVIIHVFNSAQRRIFRIWY